ncbi:MAG: hypothetical protein KF773_06170 [Deltaproteobacteria bacterium]|nr:hypothetical protein [Deltaproteobacteria bacterium]
MSDEGDEGELSGTRTKVDEAPESSEEPAGPRTQPRPPTEPPGKRSRRAAEAPPLASTAPREMPPAAPRSEKPLPNERMAERLRERVLAGKRDEVPKAQARDTRDRWERTFDWIGAHGAPWATALLALGILILFSGVFRGETLGDDLTFHMAEAARLSDCIRQGDWDFWNPSANSGYASAYYYQVVPQLASAIPAAIFGHFLFWFQLSLVTPLVVMPIATYRGARLMGAKPWQAFSAAICVAFISGASRWGGGADGTFYVGLYTQTWALSFFPLALGHSVRWLRDGRGLAPSIAWGALVFLCHPFAGISLYLAIGFGLAVHLAMPLFRLYGSQLALLGISTLLFALNLIYLVTERIPAEGKPQEELVRWLYLVPVIMLAALIARLIWNIVRNPDAGHSTEAVEVLAPIGRLLVLALCLLVATMPGWITVIIDRDGFGGFPHRVADEVGPGYKELMDWQLKGWILDNQRPMVLSWMLPIVALFARRTRIQHWLWTPAFVFALLLAVGPHAPKTADDLLPAVRFLGAMQTVLAMAVGIGVYAIAEWLWNLEEGGRSARLAQWSFSVFVCAFAVGIILLLWLGSDTSFLMRFGFRLYGGAIEDPDTVRLVLTLKALVLATYGARKAFDGLASVFGIRTAVSAIIAVLLVVMILPGSSAITTRVRVLEDYGYRDELMTVNHILEKQPPGRKQVGPGCENHWWNLLSYVYVRRPSLLQMGGGGLQASPNYDFVWSVRDFHKLAWVFDTPYFVFERSNVNQPEGETIGTTEHYEVRRHRTNGLVVPVQITGILPGGPIRSGSPTREAAINWLKSDLPYKDHVLAYDGFGGPGSAPDATVIRAFRQDSPGDEADILAEVEVRQPSTFIARESWHPRWHAYIDGVEVPIRRVTPDFPAIDVPMGNHVLAFRFERPWWAHAAWLAWPGVAFLAFLATRLLAKRRAC